MNEYIFVVPDENEPIAGESSVYYPDERDEPMQVREEIVRCRDCRHYHAEFNGCDDFGDVWHDEYANVEPDGFCAWGERKKGSE